MCFNCYLDAGQPAIINEKTQKAAELISEIYHHDGCIAGGYAHVVIDDWNLDDYSIDYCIGSATHSEFDISQSGRQACLECLTFLKELTMDERASALAIADGFLSTQ